MEANFDKVTVSSSEKVVVSIEPNLEEHGDPVGGSLVCRDITGNVGVALHAASGQFGGSSAIIRDGSLTIANFQGQRRATIHSGESLENEDGGTILLNASDDSPHPTPGGDPPPSAIVLSAPTRSLVINTPSGEAMVRLGPDGDLYLGGGGTDGDLVLRDGSGTARILLAADDQRLLIQGSSGVPVVDLGPNGNLTLGGGVSAEGHVSANGNISAEGHVSANGDISATGSISATGNLIHQRITERSRKVGPNQSYNLFPVGQDGAYIVELAAVATDPNVFDKNNQPFVKSSYSQWTVFVEANKSEPLTVVLHAQDKSGSEFWADPGPKFGVVGNKVRLAIGELAGSIRDGTLAARALYGSLEDF